MELFIELAPRNLNVRAKTHKIDLKDVAAFKRYARGQVTGTKNGYPRPTTSVERIQNVRPAWAIVKSNSSPSSEGNMLFIVAAAYHDGRLQPLEKTYNPSFIEGQEAPNKSVDNRPQV